MQQNDVAYAEVAGWWQGDSGGFVLVISQPGPCLHGPIVQIITNEGQKSTPLEKLIIICIKLALTPVVQVFDLEVLRLAVPQSRL